jgi:hypothetical protein
MPGDRIDDANGVKRVMDESRPTISHFFPFGKLSGMAGSSWLSQPTMPADRSERGIGVNGMRSLGLLRRLTPLMAREMRETLLRTLVRLSSRLSSALS